MTATPEQIIKQQYVALAKLLKVYRDKPIDKKLLQATLGFCKNLHTLATAQPDLVFAQPQLYKPQLPLIVNLAFNACVFTCLLATRNKCDPVVTIGLMCGSLSIYGCEQNSIEKYYQNELENEPPMQEHNIANLAKILKHHQQPIWLLAYSLSPSIHSNKPQNLHRLKPASAIAYFANRLSILCTPNKLQRPLSFAHAIKSLTLSSPAKYYSLLSPLLDYPGLTPPGTYVQNKNGAISVVLAIHPDGLVTKILPTKQPNTLASEQNVIVLTNANKVIKSYICQVLRSFSRLNQWWDDKLSNWMANEIHQVCIEPFQTVLPMQSAPKVLLVIQDQLTQPNTDIAVLVKAIEKEPSYAQQLQNVASISNRKKQPITSIQQGLAMLGYERTASLFLQHSLLSRLNQHYFPLQPAFLAFSQFFVFTVEELATRTHTRSLEEVKTAAYFLLSRLFTLPSLRGQLTWQTKTQFSYQVDSLLNHTSVDLKQDAILLAQAWHQDSAIIQLLQRYDQVSDEPHPKELAGVTGYLLGAGLILAKQSYFTQTSQCQATHHYLKKALLALQIKPQEWSELQQSVAIKAQIACHLL